MKSNKLIEKLSKLKKINVGCGENYLRGFINIDVEKKVSPDLIWDVTKQRLPFKDNSVKQLNCIHNLEHIEFTKWEFVLGEFYRVLKIGGLLLLAYPEFEVCSKYFLENYKNNKDFWRNTLYGRQLYPGDYHVTPMVTKDIILYLKNIGFDEFRHEPEVDQNFNTFMACKKSTLITREDAFKREVFGKK